ncbi:MAG: hypothetical protein IPJ94_13845 [Chloroflexi bacterium]|nr:hypothetical protein [Chloroflexota bacterium]
MDSLNDQIRKMKEQQVEALERKKQEKIDLEIQSALLAKNEKEMIQLAKLSTTT